MFSASADVGHQGRCRYEGSLCGQSPSSRSLLLIDTTCAVPAWYCCAYTASRLMAAPASLLYGFHVITNNLPADSFSASPAEVMERPNGKGGPERVWSQLRTCLPLSSEDDGLWTRGSIRLGFLANVQYACTVLGGRNGSGSVHPMSRGALTRAPTVPANSAMQHPVG